MSGPMSAPEVPSPTVSSTMRSAIFRTSASPTGTDRDDGGDRHAPLARRAEAGVHGGVGGEIEVGVGQHDHVVLRAAERLHALARARRGLVHVARDRRRADERHRLHVGVLEQPVDRDLVAVHDVEHAGRQPGLGPQLGDPVRGRRILLARLEDHRVAGRDRDREEPARHHRREVERADDRDDTERLANRGDVDARRHAFGEVALQQLRHPARELHDFEAARDLAHRVARAPCRARR